MEKSNEQIAWDIVINLREVTSAALTQTTIEEDGSINFELSPYGNKVYDNILNTLNKK